MIYLNAEVISGLGEDTFWTWFKREFFRSSYNTPKVLYDNDVVLRYSTLGHLDICGKQIGLLWELYPEMKEVFESNEWDEKMKKIDECAKNCTYRLVTSELMVPYYKKYGTVDVLPIGVDINIFRPINKKNELRTKYSLPKNKRIGFWCGTTHPMKGYKNLKKYAKENPDVYWVLVWKSVEQADEMHGQSNFINVKQDMMAELINACDFILSCGLLRPFFMIEWEAMACNLPVLIYGGLEKDFLPSKNPLEDILRLGWDRPTAKKLWSDYLLKRGITW